MMINPEYAKPILTLSNSLNKRNIPHTVNVIWDGLQIRFSWNDGDIIMEVNPLKLSLFITVTVQ